MNLSVLDLKDRQQQRTAVLPRSYLNALCAFVLYDIFYGI